MIGFHQIAIGVSSGLFLLVIGLVPGLFQGLVEGVRNAVSVVSGSGPTDAQPQDPQSVHVGVAGLGAALVTLTILAYLSR